MMSCKEVSEILCSGENLPLLKKIKLKLHLMLCDNCSHYAKELAMLSSAFNRLIQEKIERDGVMGKRLEKEILDKIQYLI